MFRNLLLAPPVIVVLFIAGCGPEPNVTITGSVVRNGQPLVIGPTGVLQVTLMPDVGPDEDYTSKRGECDSAGNFTILDVPKGRYKVGVEQFDPTPQVDKLNGAFQAAPSKIKRDLDGKTPLVIDLAKPEG